MGKIKFFKIKILTVPLIQFQAFITQTKFSSKVNIGSHIK